MALRNMTQFSSQPIGHCARGKRMLCEASDLMLRPGHVWEQIYDDACDVGIALRNPRSGNVTRWYQCEGETVLDDGDVILWVFRPTSETIYRNPGLEGYVLHIIND
jgi:hypothetical protein